MASSSPGRSPRRFTASTDVLWRPKRRRTAELNESHSCSPAFSPVPLKIFVRSETNAETEIRSTIHTPTVMSLLPRLVRSARHREWNRAGQLQSRGEHPVTHSDYGGTSGRRRPDSRYHGNPPE